MNRKFVCSFFSFLVIALLSLSACAPVITPMPTPSATPAPVHWTYEGEEGPTHWGNLSPDYATCSTGISQSPVDISNSAPKDRANLVFHYLPSKINILNNGHTIQVNYDSGSYIDLDGVRYNLVQFHFHAPSEHSLNGKLAEAELHLVHKSDDGKLAVVGILIEIGTENPAFKSTWDNLPFTKGSVRQLSAEVDALAMLPARQETYRYIGSLTTPPCTEGVKWNVMVEPVEMSKTQLAAFRSIFEGNNRPVQPLDGRSFIKDPTTPPLTPAP